MALAAVRLYGWSCSMKMDPSMFSLHSMQVRSHRASGSSPGASCPLLAEPAAPTLTLLDASWSPCIDAIVAPTPVGAVMPVGAVSAEPRRVLCVLCGLCSPAGGDAAGALAPSSLSACRCSSLKLAVPQRRGWGPSPLAKPTMDRSIGVGQVSWFSHSKRGMHISKCF